MALERSLVLFPLLILVLLELGWIQPPRDKESSAMKFQRQHMDSGSNPTSNANYCNEMMKHLKACSSFPFPLPFRLPQDISACLCVQAVCFKRNVACKNGQTNCYQSTSSMHITDCRLTSNSKYPNCSYRTSQMEGSIVVACEGNPYVPVHFDASVDSST
ncbi:Ribonuclease pancreatic [Fukomys damarensis]|uniref:pancreatic ribonuclease n=1 Tax=Fukomys damarensis TaxID=885580 RepID=A0A091D920_FUKDA|nr:Ribonuclease pancreatic [Fukomys damarensis]